MAERALFLWNNDHIERLIKHNLKVILPIIFPALEKNTSTHWNLAVQGLALNVRKIYADHTPELFDDCLHKLVDDEAQSEAARARRESTWRRLEDLAASGSITTTPVARARLPGLESI